jgi:hypothetical protein
MSELAQFAIDWSGRRQRFPVCLSANLLVFLSLQQSHPTNPIFKTAGNIQGKSSRF